MTLQVTGRKSEGLNYNFAEIGDFRNREHCIISMCYVPQYFRLDAM